MLNGPWTPRWACQYLPAGREIHGGVGGGGELLNASFIKLKPNAGGFFGHPSGFTFKYSYLKGLSHEMELTFVDMYEYI